MNLWTVRWPADAFEEDQEYHLVWAWGSDEARDISWLNREWTSDGGYWSSFAAEQSTIATYLHAGVRATPRHDHPHEERRYVVMRACGYRDEGDNYPCEQCGLYAMGLTSFCDECCCCGECGCKCKEDEEEA